MRAFVRLRQMLSAHKDLERKLAELEKKYDEQFSVVFEAIRQLMIPPDKKQRKIYPVKLWYTTWLEEGYTIRGVKGKRQTEFVFHLTGVGFEVKEPKARYTKKKKIKMRGER